MSPLHLTTKLPLLASRTARRHCLGLQTTSFSASSRAKSPRPDATALLSDLEHLFASPAKSPRADGAPGRSKLSRLPELPPQERHLVHDASNTGQLDGNPAKHLAVDIGGAQRLFDCIFLRDSCTCPQCVDPHSRQKLFQTSDIPPNLKGRYELTGDEETGLSVEVLWENDVPGYGPEHRTRHSIDWLCRALSTALELRNEAQTDVKVLWDKDTITKNNKWVEYEAWMAEDEVLYDALSHLNKYGLLFLKGVPESEESVVNIAGRIGLLKDTFYGRTWDVRSKPRAENIAYTPQFLGLHMDLLYTSNPPHLQLLHSLRARAPRGESFFSDSFHAAHKLRAKSEVHFRKLCTYPVPYHYHHPTHHYHHTRCTIETLRAMKHDEAIPPIHRVNWSPPFQAPFDKHIGGGYQPALRDYVAAAHAFEKLLSAKSNVYEYRLEEGECVIFDNRRVLHARRAFDATKGERWLKGAYVDDDVFFSRLRVLQERFEGRWTADGVAREVVK
ncbi:hypothetical protein BDV95DRAFT_591557 [Massariosphaeria phaeospora]|uniref:TauD/TfdA-like domain-containing protein n=1 Tax=Massariosphaeria phaeospora TaxID=100035 RepID=A0A7C8II46_9PLEO|nr:hypothetical protein BDV95DRAFT_591557 [Massariosphaeria phaeospora]